LIHYHGTPLTPRAKLLPLAGKHFCVSYAEPRDAGVCMEIGQSVLWDNGAFSAFTQGRAVDWATYYHWLEPKLGHPHWAVIPDVIDGTVEQQQDLLRRWPFGHFGAPVWHMGLSIIYLLGLAEKWPRLCFGSTGQYWRVGSDSWRRRADEAFNELAKRHQRLPWVHMLRGMALGGSHYPFASVDSANFARNYATARRDPEIMAREIDGIQCPIRWQEQPEQLEMIA
jgi:hypothetical protein